MSASASRAADTNLMNCSFSSLQSFDARAQNELAEFLHVAFDYGAELLGRIAYRRQAELVIAHLDVRRLQRLHDALVDRSHSVSGRVRRSEQAVPERKLVSL